MQTDRQTPANTHAGRQRQTERQTVGHKKDSQAKTKRQLRQTGQNRQIDRSRQTDRQTDRQVGRQTARDSQTDKGVLRSCRRVLQLPTIPHSPTPLTACPITTRIQAEQHTSQLSSVSALALPLMMMVLCNRTVSGYFLWCPCGVARHSQQDCFQVGQAAVSDLPPIDSEGLIDFWTIILRRY